jgi:hypothetical protein
LPSGRTSEGAAAEDKDVDDEVVLVFDDDGDDAAILDDTADDRFEDTVAEDDRIVVLADVAAGVNEVLGVVLATVLPGLVEPPYVHPSPSGIDGP